MNEDSEPIVVEHHAGFVNMLGDSIGGMGFKMMAILLLLFILVNSDVFVMRILAKVNGAVDLNAATNYGTIIQGIFLVMAYIVLDTLVKNNVI